MKALLTISLVLISLLVNAMQLVPFRSEDHKLKVYRMDSVLIMADSAYVISGVRAQLLNDKLADLQRAYAANAQLVDVNAVLLDKVMEIERLVLQLMQHMQEDQARVSMNIDELLSDMDSHIQELQLTNVQLDQQNAELKKQLAAMEQTIKRLKRAIRKLWWHSALKKVLIGLAGFGLGWFVATNAT